MDLDRQETKFKEMQYCTLELSTEGLGQWWRQVFDVFLSIVCQITDWYTRTWIGGQDDTPLDYSNRLRQLDQPPEMTRLIPWKTPQLLEGWRAAIAMGTNDGPLTGLSNG